VIGGGSGVASGGANDSFRFAHTQLTGDGAITARVTGVPLASPANNNAKAGVMIRESLAANSRSAFVALTPGSASGVIFQSRAATGGNTSTASATLGVWPPYWVRLVRVGNIFTAYRSPDGVSWTQLGTPQSIAMGATVQVGLASTASDNNQVNVGKFEHVSIVNAPSVAIAQVAPDPRGSAIPSIMFTFDQPVIGFEPPDVQLTRASTIVSLAGATLESTDGGRTWMLGGLGGLTGRVGDYAIAIADDAATNSAFVPLRAAASEGWTMNFLGGTAGDEQMKLVATTGTSADYFLGGVYQYSFNPAALGAPLLLDGGGGTDALDLDGVAVTLASTQTLSSIALNDGATIDARDHDLLVDYPAGAPSPIGVSSGSAYTGLSGEIGSGVFSSLSQAQQGVTGLGIAEARDILNLAADATALWSGRAVDASTVLIKYTYVGDLTLDGYIDAVDYGHIDNWVQFPGTTGYFNGDVNYDGVIDAQDYGYIDNNIQVQGPPL
jgi:hypothetical protein